ncbi:MAG: alpha/beta hydrolase [Gammaproteobacteria bacterium]|nr:alpha/beta hydrolase [Gammaproteobacteria bacterium]
MTTKHLLDPELHPLLDLVPPFELDDEQLHLMRENPSMAAELGDPAQAGVTREEVHASADAGPEVRALLYRPSDRAATGAGYLHIHGGGYVMGTPEMSDPVNLEICARLGAVVLSVDYRVAPEHPIPAPLDDCYTGLAWLHEQAPAFGVDRDRIGIGGESAGGGLAAALAIKARDAGEYAICHQHLTYPMLDDRTGTPEQPGDPLVGEFIWTRQSNQYGWRSYLGDAPAEAPQVPARLDDFAGLPPTWMATAALDLFRDENIDYARKLMLAGVRTELVSYPAACHGFQMVPGTQFAKRYAQDHLHALARGLGVPVKS